MDASPHTAASRFSRVTRLVLRCSLVAPSLCHAALIDRGGGLIYDTDWNITWLADATYGAGSAYDAADGISDGQMTWQNAMEWAASLSYYDSVRQVTYSDWMLPASDTCRGYTCRNSAMAHLYYHELGGVSGFPLRSIGVFDNLPGGAYWSSTISSVGYAYDFHFDEGFQHVNHIGGSLYAWAMRYGDVSISSVPAPGAALLLSSGLIALFGLARKHSDRTC